MSILNSVTDFSDEDLEEFYTDSGVESDEGSGKWSLDVGHAIQTLLAKKIVAIITDKLLLVCLFLIFLP